MKRMFVGATLITAATFAIVAAAIAAPSGPDSSTTTLTFVGKATSFTHVDNPPRNVFGQGDYVVYAGVETRARGTEPLGSAAGQCTQHSKTGAKKVTLFCTSTFTLAAGQIIIAGAVVDEAKRSVVAVIGGTGSYRGARGQAVESYIDDESSRWTLTFDTR
ncbi:MAG: allene oxide cyclase barrel-like domain-containing protein [Gaiellaceae bacterium]